MKLCDYGCGQEAKFPFKNGKWCCSKSQRQCPTQRDKTSIQSKEMWEDSNSGINSSSCKEKRSKSMKDAWQDPNSGLNTPAHKENQSNIMKDLWKDPYSTYHSKSYKENHSNSIKKLYENPLYRKKQSDKMKKIRRNPNNKYNSILCKKKQSEGIKKARKDPNSKYNSISYKEKVSNNVKEIWNNPNSIFNSILFRKEKRNTAKKVWEDPTSKLYLRKLTIENINKKYPFFSKIEDMRYNPNKPEEKEIQVHCKNYECENSKEKDGWFTPTLRQIGDRKNQLEKDDGNDGSYLYCSQHCKDTCILFGLKGDPYKTLNLPYTSSELDVFNKLVLKRDNEICYYCKKHHATIVHHLRPQKLEPFFALDPDYAISVCAKCHYKYGHPTGSKHSTGNLAKIVCSVESQKFLNQKLEFSK